MKLITISVLLLVLCGAVVSKSLSLAKLSSKAKQLLRHRRLPKSDKIYRTEQQLGDLEVKNAKAEEKLLSDPEGLENKYVQYRNDNLYVLVTPKSLALELAQETQPRLQQRTVTLNQYQLYIFDSPAGDRSVRGNTVGLALADIVQESDDLTSNECCRRVSPVLPPMKLTLTSSSPFLHCIRVEGVENSWQICSEDIIQIESFRAELILRALAAKEVYLKNPLFLTEPHPFDGHWTWNRQDEWGQTCLNGFSQSPVEIKSEAAQTRDMEFVWNYLPTPEFPNIKFDGHEIVISGNFGSFLLKQRNTNGHTQEEFFANKITFKSAPEHNIGNADAEMLVHHTSLLGNKAIVSFLLEVDDTLDQPNQFFDQIKPDLWDNQNGFDFDLDEQIDLDALADGGAKSFFNKSFFLYIGSDSTPPCEEGVYRIVFKNTIKLRPSQLDAVQDELFDRNLEPFGNFRHPSPLNFRNVYFHADTESECAGLRNFPFDPRGKKDLDEQISEENGKAVASKRTVVNYAHVATDIVTGKVGKHLTVEEVDPSTLKKDTITKLLQGDVLAESDIEKAKRRKHHRRRK